MKVNDDDDDGEQMCVLPPPRALVSIEDILARAGMTFAIDQSLTMRQCDPVSTPRDYRENTQHCEISNKHLVILVEAAQIKYL